MILYRFVAAAGLSLSDALAGALVAGSLLVLIALASSVGYAKTRLLGAAVAAECSKPRESQRVRADTPLPTRGAGT